MRATHRRPRAHRELRVWHRSIALVVHTFAVARRLPGEEARDLADQMRRAAVSIPSNVAEGNGRAHLGDYLHHLSYARGSLSELETQFVVASELGYLDEAESEAAMAMVDHVGALLGALITALQRRREQLVTRAHG
jgi:four helix bundle protein